MTDAARMARSVRHALGDALIGLGVRLTHDAGPAMTPEQEERTRRILAAARAMIEAERLHEGDQCSRSQPFGRS